MLLNRGMKRQMKWILVGLFLVSCSLLFLGEQYLREGFVSRTCPSGYTFFNDKTGNSLCCRGTYNANGHTCSGTNKNDICAFVRGVRDPRNPGRILRTCDEIVNDLANNGAGKYCASNMPNYITPGISNPGMYASKQGGCSISPAIGNGSGFPMGSMNGQWMPLQPMCNISGASDLIKRMKDDTKFESPSCETVKLQETVKCPANMSIKYDKNMYVHCMQNNYKYDPKIDAPPFCYPDEIIGMIPDNTSGKLLGLEKAKNDCMSCSYFKKRYIDKDTTAKCVRR